MPITSGTLGRLRSVSRRGADVVFSFESSDLVLTPVMPNVIRHTWVPTHWRLHAQQVADDYAVRRAGLPPPHTADLTETSEVLRIRTAGLVIETRCDPFSLQYRAADGRVLLEEAAEGGLSWSYWEYALRYKLEHDDHFYGMGQPDQLAGSLGIDHRGHLLEVWNRHSPPAETVFPAFLNPRGYGLLVDNPYRAQWDLGHGDPRSFSYRARGGGLQYYFFHAPDLGGLLRVFMELTGFPPHPPRWIFGLLQSRYGYRHREELEAIARTFRNKRLPCDALILDLFWFAQMGDLEFDATHWPDPQEMIRRLREQGFRVMVIEEPYVTVKSTNYPAARDGGYLAKHYDGSPYTFEFWPGQCALIDFSNPAAREWWTQKHRPLLEMGIAGWWTDLNEPTRHFEDMVHHGGSATAVHNLTALRMHESIYEAHQRYAPPQRVFILSRSAFPGSQRYGAALWSGDVDMTFAALRKQVAVGLSAGMAGIAFWGSDIGGFGFAGKCTTELYIRWFQFGAFCPLFRPHGDQTQLREPWQFGPECEAICRKYLELRYRLLPYIYNLAHEACTAGLPLMRPLALHFPGDPQVIDLADQYLFGREILVAPVLDEGAQERSVYLPAGIWTDLWSGRVHAGPGFLKVRAPLDTIPLFIAQGAIIPMGPDMQYSGERPLDPLALEIYRGADRSVTLYEDDGDSTAYQSDQYAETLVEVRADEEELLCTVNAARGGFEGYRPARNLVLNIHHQDSVKEVSCGQAIARLSSAESLERTTQGWWWNSESRMLTVKLVRTTGPLAVRVRAA